MSDWIPKRLHVGRSATPDEIVKLEAALDDPPRWYVEMLSMPIVDGSFQLPAEHDLSEQGAELRVMRADDIVQEKDDLLPGLVAFLAGYVPFAECLEGGGDPYFLKLENSPEATTLVRIYHERVDEETGLGPGAVEHVSESVVAFFQHALRLEQEAD